MNKTMLVLIIPFVVAFPAEAQHIGFSVGYVDPQMEHFGGAVGFTGFTDYVFPDAGFLIGGEVGYWQKTETLTFLGVGYDPYYGYYYYTFDADVKMADLSLAGHLGWQLPARKGIVLPYLGVAPGAHIIKANVRVSGASSGETWTKFGVDFLGGVKFNTHSDFQPFVIIRYSLLTDSDYDDWNHLFVGAGVEFVFVRY